MTLNMKRLLMVCLTVVIATQGLFAGNPDRAGQAGASELLVNPWSRSLGWNNVNYSNIRGIEAMRVNVAGLAFLDKTGVGFSRTEYLVGSGINVNALGFGQNLGDGTLGLSVMTVGYGDIDITTTNQPEGGLGTFSPQFVNIGIAYAHSFADFIHGGVVVRIVSEGIPDARATGVAIDAGLQYNTGNDTYPDKFKFGVSLRNVGTPMSFSGDGLKFRADVIAGTYQNSVSQLSQAFELPSQLNIGASYDMYVQYKHRVTVAGSFTSNAFYRDQIGLGLEYGLKVKGREMFLLRGGYRYEEGFLNSEVLNGNAFTGWAGGFTVMIPFSSDKDVPRMALDYAYRTTNPSFQGSHTVGVTLDF